MVLMLQIEQNRAFKSSTLIVHNADWFGLLRALASWSEWHVEHCN
jgi:hypothetical protein